jgi:hypothetical protein
VRVRSGPATVTRAFGHSAIDPGSQDVCRGWPLSHPAYAGPTQHAAGVDTRRKGVR